MNVNRMRADALKHKMEMEAAFNGEAVHARHV